MAYVVPSEARGAHLTFTLSSYVLLGVALCLKGWGVNHVSLTASVVSSEACGVHPTFTLSFASEVVSSPDPTLKRREKGSGDFGQFSWFGRLWARAPTRVRLSRARI